MFRRAADEVVRGDRVTVFRTPSMPRVPHLHGVVAHVPLEADDAVYAEHWAGHRPVEITIEEDQIVIRRAGGGEDDDED